MSASNQLPLASNTQPCYFLAIPPELRLIIYEMLRPERNVQQFCFGSRVTTPWFYTMVTPPVPDAGGTMRRGRGVRKRVRRQLPDTALLKICRLINTEATPVLYGRTEFSFCCRDYRTGPSLSLGPISRFTVPRRLGSIWIGIERTTLCYKRSAERRRIRTLLKKVDYGSGLGHISIHLTEFGKGDGKRECKAVYHLFKNARCPIKVQIRFMVSRDVWQEEPTENRDLTSHREMIRALNATDVSSAN